MSSTEQASREEPTPARVWTLTVVHHVDPAMLGRRVVVGGAEGVVLGRDLAALSGERDWRLSRVHAEVRARGDGLFVTDEGSRNGTFVDGERVRSATLGEDAVLGVGQMLLLCQHRPPLFCTPDHPRIAGVSAACAELLADLERVAGDRDPVVLVGETGTGKGLCAEELHVLRKRLGPLVTVHCAALTDERLHAQLFGTADAPGVLEGAEGGTLFLDGVDDASHAVQAALLQFLEDREVRRLGSAGARRVDAAVVAGSSRPLATLVVERRLRPDFAARLGRRAVEIAPLRARREDVTAIAARRLRTFDGAPHLHPALALALLLHDWPGNVRELHAVLELAASLREGNDGARELRLHPRVAAQLDGGPASAGSRRDVFVVARSGAWFRAPGVGLVSLGARRQLERVLEALAEAREHSPSEVRSVSALVAAGWPGERVLPRAGASRVYVSITSLRRLGLRDAIVRTPEGYRLGDDVRVGDDPAPT